ncbi:MAG: SusC/RagA family TonB-linked outer membrane protein [Tenuifilaceae bacterium]|jgi:TonB-linked SusC/RagA family outer membrane protein|nr:SusC/RagA family TonB-linked outer membrane protein [Tenuifilaceae bacterium]
MKKLCVFLACVVFVGVNFLQAQTVQITGTVTSADDGMPIPGASVQVKGTTIGVATDADGKYSLGVPATATTLTFSFIGYKVQEVEISGRTVINVVLETDAVALEEVIVSGLAAATPRSKLAVSVERVGEERISQVPARSAASALQGKVSGVTVTNSTGEPGGSSTILIRGATQLAGSQDPLIIVDGAILEGTLSDINVNDIESLEVVKGASASAMFGSRAGNGVIVITTKRGKDAKEGVSNIIVRNEFGRNQIGKKYDLNKSHAFVLADDWEDYKGIYTKYAGVTYPDGYTGGAGYSGARGLKEDLYMDNPFALLNDHQADMFPGNNFYTNYVSLSGNLGKTNFFTSFENFHEGGLLYGTEGYDRNSFRVNVDHKFTDKITLNASNVYVRSHTQNPGGDSKYNGGVFFNLLLMSPDVNLQNENPDGQPYLFIPDPWEATTENPLYSLYKKENYNERNRLLGTYNLKWDIFDFLSVEGKYAYENSRTDITELDPYDTWERQGAGPGYSEGRLYKYNNKIFSQTAQATLNLNKQFGDFNTRAKFSYLLEDYRYDWFSATGNNFSVKDLPTFGAIASADKTASNGQERIMAENLFGILYLDYKDRYIFDGMVRRDGSSLFGINERYKTYYRVSGAWRISQDIEIPGIDELKIRSAYGTAGQRPHLFAMQYEVMTLIGGTPSGKAQLGNKNLKPSLSTEMEIGLNVDFLKRFRFEAVYSFTNTDDQFLNVPLAAHLGGWGSQWQNAGALEARVIEASFGANLISNSDFTWDMNLVFDRVRTEITRLDVPAYQTGPQGQEGFKVFYIKEGEVFGAIYGEDWVKSLDQMAKQLPTDATIDDYTINSDGYVIRKGTEGTIYEAPIKVLDENGTVLYGKIGDTTPDFKLGLTTNLNYKGIGLYMLWEWKQGGDVYNRTAQWLTRDNRHGMMDQAGKEENAKKTIPYYKTFYDVNNVNSFWVEDASYVKLREVSLFYEIPKNLISGFAKGAFKSVKIGLVGRNLLTFSKYSGYDPEVQTNDGTAQFFAYDFMGYPNYRTFSGSLELKF